MNAGKGERVFEVAVGHVAAADGAVGRTKAAARHCARLHLPVRQVWPTADWKAEVVLTHEAVQVPTSSSVASCADSDRSAASGAVTGSASLYRVRAGVGTVASRKLRDCRGMLASVYIQVPATCSIATSAGEIISFT